MFRTESSRSFFIGYNDTAPTEIYSLSLHDALPIWPCSAPPCVHRIMPGCGPGVFWCWRGRIWSGWANSSMQRLQIRRSEEHTSELQSRPHLVCRLLLEKKNRDGKELLIPMADDHIQ